MTTHLMSTQSVQQPVSRTRRFFRAVGRGFKAAGILAAGLMTAGGVVAACGDNWPPLREDASMRDAHADLRQREDMGREKCDCPDALVSKDAGADAMADVKADVHTTIKPDAGSDASIADAGMADARADVTPRVDAGVADAPSDVTADARTPRMDGSTCPCPDGAVADAMPDLAAPDAGVADARPDAMVADAGPDLGTPPSPVLKILASRATPTGFRVFLIDEFGSPAQLTTWEDEVLGPRHDIHPTWCIEGGVVTAVFESDREGSMRLFKIEIDLSASPPVATEPVALTDGSTVDQNPQCSNSGRVFYVCGENLCSIHLDASGLTVVFSNAAYTFKRSPSVSDAEDLMAFSAEFPAGSAPAVFGVELMGGIATGEPVRITPEGVSASSPSLTASGLSVAFNTPPSIVQVAVIDVGADSYRVLTVGSPEFPTINGTPRFVRPNSTIILFHSDSDRLGPSNIFSVPADGSTSPVDLSRDPAADYRTPEGRLFPAE